MYRITSWLVAVTLTLGAPGSACAGLITVIGNVGDGTVGNALADNLSDPMIRVGVAGNDVHGQAIVFFFALPKVSSPGSIVGAELDLQYLGISQFTVTTVPNFNADLFGLGVQSTPTIFGSDYYDGNASLSSDALIIAGLVTPTTNTGRLQVSGGNLLAFVQSLYQPDGTPTAAYAVFRVNPDVHLPPFSNPYRGYEFASADNTDSNGAFVPQLSLTVVPEPSTLALFLVGAVVVAGYGWRRTFRGRIAMRSAQGWTAAGE